MAPPDDSLRSLRDFRASAPPGGRHLVPAGQPGSPGAPQPTGFFAGVGFLVEGFRMYRSHPRLMRLGLLPAVITFLVLVAAFLAMLFFVEPLVDFITPFMDSWPAILRDGARLILKIAIGMLWVILSVLGYVTLTLILGQPFYEAISKRVEDHLGGVPGEVNVSFWRSAPRTALDSLRLAGRALVVAVFLLLIQFIPGIGHAAAIVFGAFFVGWVLALELTSVPFERRGLYYRDRKRALGRYRLMTHGFGAATFLCFLIPLGAVIFMPPAVAGATLLSRRILQPDS